MLVLICCSLDCKCVCYPQYVFFCQLDVAFLFTAIGFFILLGMLFFGLWGFLLGVATLAACCNMHMKLSVAICTSSCSLSLVAGFIVSRTSVLYISQFICELCSLGGVCRPETVVFIVAIIGEWSEVRSRLACISI